MLETIVQLPNCTIEKVRVEESTVVITLYSNNKEGSCPLCQQMSSSVHSYYLRRPSDLPMFNQQVKLELQSKRLRCLNDNCQQKTFCERLEEWLPVYGRRTKRLSKAIYETGIMAGGQAGSKLLRIINIHSSRDTILRTLRQEPLVEPEIPRVLGVDDWAKHKGINYGTILVDLEKHQVIELLPDRQAETLAEWLKEHPGIEMVTRDRSPTYASAVSEGAPQAEQIADRFHLLQNLTEATAKVLKQHMQEVKRALTEDGLEEDETLGEEKLAPLKITEADKRRMEQVKEVHRLHQLGHYQKAIARQLHITRKTVRYYLELSPEDVILRRRPRRSLITPFVPHLQKRWQEGCHNQMQLYREIRAQGYKGTDSNVRKYIRERIQANDGKQPICQVIPTSRDLAFMMTQSPEKRTAATKILLKRLQDASEKIALCMQLVSEFATMVRLKLPDKLTPWVQKAQSSGLSGLANLAAGLLTDEAAVRAALTSEWSNGQTEGFINKLKLLKRQMYGRAKLDLLKIRLLALNPSGTKSA